MRKALLLVAGLLVLAGGVAYAATPGANGTINGCYKTSKGDLRVIDTEAGQSCDSNETPISWSQTGPQGPQGIQGPPGERGPQGEPGSPGADGAVAFGRVSSDGTLVDGRGATVTRQQEGVYELTPTDRPNFEGCVIVATQRGIPGEISADADVPELSGSSGVATFTSQGIPGPELDDRPFSFAVFC